MAATTPYSIDEATLARDKKTAFGAPRQCLHDWSRDATMLCLPKY
jgi:hypothetical protein